MVLLVFIIEKPLRLIKCFEFIIFIRLRNKIVKFREKWKKQHFLKWFGSLKIF